MNLSRKCKGLGMRGLKLSVDILYLRKNEQQHNKKTDVRTVFWLMVLLNAQKSKVQSDLVIFVQLGMKFVWVCKKLYIY